MSEPTSLYVHIPFCIRKCPYCGFFSRTGCAGLTAAYLEALKRELAAQARPLPMRTIYIGGGTPTILPAKHLRTLLQTIGSLIEREPQCEFTIEANPGTLDAGKAAALREGGVNRISLGAQSFHPATLHTLGRIHGPDEIHQAVDILREQGFQNIGLDLIYAVPGQTAAEWSADLEAAIALGVRHVSAYGLSFEAGTEFERALRAGELAQAADQVYLDMHDCARRRLPAAGFEHYEISNFARPGFESLHNCNYWLNGAYLGIGASATAFVDGERRTNVAHIEKYIEMILSGSPAVDFSERLQPEEFARETAALNMRYLPGIDRRSFFDRTGFDLETLFADEIDFHLECGLLEYDGDVLRLTPKAVAVADSVSAAFLQK